MFELEIKEKDDLKTNLIIGLLIGAIVLIKQNTGAIICIANGIICLRLCVKKPTSKRIYLIRAFVSLVPFALYAMYILVIGAFPYFMEYAIQGISTFTHRYTLLDFCIESPFFVPYLILIIVMILIIAKNMLAGRMSNYQFASFAFSIAWASIIYPLADVSHVILVLFTLVPAFVTYYSFDKIHRKEIAIAAVFSVFVLHFMLTLSLPIDAQFNVSKLDNFQGLIIDENIENVISMVDEYILEKEENGYTVRIADASASIFKIPLNEYEKNWDMLLVGNIGASSVEYLLEADGPTIYLVMKDESNYSMQDHYDLIRYIKNNYKYVDEVAGFNVYENEE